MKPIKLILFCVIVTLIMAFSWAIGSLIGNVITSSAPPPPPDASNAGFIFLAVCAFNSILIYMLLRATDTYSGSRRLMALTLFVFVIQSLLPQMDTFFFAPGIGIGYDQATAIVIAGIVVSITTVILAAIIYKKFKGSPAAEKLLVIPGIESKKILLPLALLVVVAYPFLYLTFGYYVAWQSESLRIYYTSSTDMRSYAGGIADAFGNGLYFFQVLRALIWVAVTVPIVIMLKEKTAQFVVVGLLCALLPSSLLFIPNPYMPSEIAMVHFVETSTSNLVWGLLMVWVIRKLI